MTTNARSAEVIRHAMYIEKGSDLELENHFFQNLSDDQLDAPYGQSDKTVREVWQSSKDRRAEWEAANALLEEMLQVRGL